MASRVRVQNDSPRSIWVLIQENTRHLAESETRKVGETDFELYYRDVVEGHVKCPIEEIPVEVGGSREHEFKSHLRTYWEESAKETYVWSGFVESGEVEVPPGRGCNWDRKGDEDIYYISVRSNGTMVANAMSRRGALVTIDKSGHINDEPAPRIRIADKNPVYLFRASKTRSKCVGDPKTGRGSNWDAGTFGNTPGAHVLELVSGKVLKTGCAVRIVAGSTNLQDKAFKYLYCSENGWVYYDRKRDSGGNSQVQQWILSKTSAAGNSRDVYLCFGDTVKISNRYWKDSNLGVKGDWLECTRHDSTEWVLEPLKGR
jgi:hypothetical protein